MRADLPDALGARPIRVAFCAASVGCGHTRAAAAIHDALELRGRLAHADFLEALEDAPRWFTRVYRDGYLAAVRLAPRAVGAVYRRTDVPLRERRTLGSLLDRAEDHLLRAMSRRSELHAADVVVSTHFLTTALLGRLRARGALHAPLATVVTDEHPHALWLHRGCDLTCVASAAARARAVEGGLAPARVAVTGIPIDPRFCASPGLHEPGTPMVLLTGGGHGLGDLPAAVHSLAHHARQARVVVVCGRNERLAQQLAPLASAAGTMPCGEPRVTVLGYTNRMHDLLAAATLLVGKPGGLTSTEARAMGVPMLLLRPIPGQEERNAAAMVATGSAVPLQSAMEAGVVAARLLGDPVRLRSMRLAASAAGRPRAAFDAASAVAELAQRFSSPARLTGRSAASSAR